MLDDIIVLKFGDSVLHGPAALPTAVHEIYRWYRRGWRVVALVSALGKTTERLVQEMQALTSDSASYACTRLFATGEQHAAALLGVALDRVGIPARVIDPHDISFTVRHELGDESATVDAPALRALFRDLTRVIVVPSGYGHDAQGRLQPLSPDGSDLTAIYLAQALHATRCRLLNDAGCVDEPSPSGADTASLQRFAALGYAQALELGSSHIDPTAIGWLARHSTSVEIAPVIATHETVIGPYADALSTKLPAPPMRVLILGLGTVGGGVYERLKAMPNHFRVVGALVRERPKHHASGIAADTLQDDVEVAAAVETDVVVDALPGFEPSRTLVQRFLSRGISVISANKTLIAAAGPPLRSLAAHHDAYLCYSAAVGGGTPMLEALRREAHQAEVRSITGILNGTCNFVLDCCSRGDSLEAAIRCARAAGFAEVDPIDDLSGQDAARKLRILARHAFGQELHSLKVDLLDLVSLERLRSSLQAGQALRQIARAWMVGKCVFGQVSLEAVAGDDAFGQVRAEWNRLIIRRSEGSDIHVTGRGAGRWPTTESIIADLLDVRFARLASAHRSLHSAAF